MSNTRNSQTGRVAPLPEHYWTSIPMIRKNPLYLYGYSGRVLGSHPTFNTTILEKYMETIC